MKKVKYTALLLLAMCAFDGTAQTAKSAYFLEGAFHNTQLNPAMAPERGFFSMPILGNMMIGVNGNVGISNFLYPYGDGQLTTFMSGSVSADEFLGKLPSTLRLGMDLDMTLLAAGFRAFGGYNTFNVTLQSQMSMGLPSGFFRFAKEGFKHQQHSFSGINLHTMNYAAVTLGHSREIIDGLRVGVNLKYLIGLAYADITVDKLNLEANGEHWMVESHAQAHLATFMEMRVPTTPDGKIGDFEEMEIGAFTPSATGFGVDLGATYDMKNFVPGLKLSASVVDLGFINWKYMNKASTKETKIEYKGFEEINPDDMDASIDEQLSQFTEDAEGMMDFYVDDKAQAMKTSLGATMYLGAEYEMPFYRKLSVGGLYGQRFSKETGWYDVRGYINISPLGWLEASANYGVTSFGTSFGWMFNFHPAGLSFFVGSDYMITKVTPQFLPVNELNGNITFGINMPVGRKK